MISGKHPHPFARSVRQVMWKFGRGTVLCSNQKFRRRDLLHAGCKLALDLDSLFFTAVFSLSNNRFFNDPFDFHWEASGVSFQSFFASCLLELFSSVAPPLYWSWTMKSQFSTFCFEHSHKPWDSERSPAAPSLKYHQNHLPLEQRVIQTYSTLSGLLGISLATVVVVCLAEVNDGILFNNKCLTD